MRWFRGCPALSRLHAAPWSRGSRTRTGECGFIVARASSERSQHPVRALMSSARMAGVTWL